VEQLAALDRFYNDIISCLRKACELCIPHKRSITNQFNVPGSNTFVKEKHDDTRQAYFFWLENGKPRFGVLFDDMQKSQAKFKLALRYCREHVDEMKADACANAVFDKDAKRFWHEVYKLSNVKATTNVSTIAGKVGDRQIADMWKQYNCIVLNMIM